MIIKHDYSYLTGKDKTTIEQGIARLAVYSFRFDRYISEEQGTENQRLANMLGTTSEEWKQHCEQYRCRIAEQNTAVLDALEQSGLVLGQYPPTPLHNHYDLWFWCNCKSGERLLDYVTLSVNHELPIEQQQEIIERATAVFNKMQTTDNRAIVQYDAIYNEQKLAEIAEQFAENTYGRDSRA